jgi:hypothetical protein
MFYWIARLSDGLPAAVLAGFLSLLMVAFTWAGIILFRPFVSAWLRRQGGRNELVNSAAAGFSLYYGLLLGLLSVAAYQSSNEVEDAVTREASTLAALYRSCEAYPEPLRGDLQTLLRDYTLYVINKDWPAHQQRFVPMGGENRLLAFRRQLLSFEPQSKTQEIAQEANVQELAKLMSAREQRLAGVSTSIPGTLWYAVWIGAVVNILLIWLLDMRLTLHLFLGGLISFFLGVMIFIIYTMDEPLQGDVRVSPGPYARAYEMVMKWDEPG